MIVVIIMGMVIGGETTVAMVVPVAPELLEFPLNALHLAGQDAQALSGAVNIRRSGVELYPRNRYSGNGCGGRMTK